MTLKGKRAIVTGSNSGIGLGVAESLAAAGVDVVLNSFTDRPEDHELARDLGARHGVTARYIAAEMSKGAECRALVEMAGGCDILVNNAGIQHVSAVESFPEDRWDAIIAINLTSNFHTIKAALPGMRAKNWGRIINIASVHGLVASAQKSAYVAAKHGVVGLTKAVALETATTGVTCNAICPGWVLTPLVQKQIDDRATQQNISGDEARKSLVGEKQPSQDFVTTDQLGQLAVFLCSPAGAQIRGAAWNVDGGWYAQ